MPHHPTEPGGASVTSPPDFTRSPYTGWTREHWEALADRTLTAVEPYRSPAGARIDLPGPASVSGTVSDGLEGFARTLLIAGFLVAGRDGGDPGNLLERYATGLAAGTDPASPESWPRPDDELNQAKVEAASIALVLQLTRPWLWDRLDERVREQTVDWLSAVIGQWYPQSNWTWFRIIVESFLREVGGPWSATEIEESLAVHASLRRSNGWLADGHGRGFDHYNGWALHVYPLLWTRLFDVTGTLCPPALREQWTADLGRYTDDVLRLIGADGSPLLQGRSLTYRFATAAPLWMAAITGAGQHPPGLLRRAASGTVSHFAKHETFEPHGLLSLGWHGTWPQMRQSYSGPGSPYWAAKGMLGLFLPSDHPVWTDEEQPLPIETGDIARVVEAPGWLVSARQSDGIVTVLNHGTDAARPGATCADSPLYARLGYSTATLPSLTGPSVAGPVDNSVVLLDPEGRASHRSGFRTLFARQLADGALVAASQGPVGWIEATDETAPNFGSGPTGTVTPGPVLTIASLVRDGTEVRLARVDSATSGMKLRIGGWPVASSKPPRSDSDIRQAHPVAEVTGDDLRSVIRGLRGLNEAGVTVEQGTSPLGEYTAVPWLTTQPVSGGEIVAALVTLTRQTADEPPPVVAVERLAGSGDRIIVSWHQGEPTEFMLPT
ncbi:DUF2264 domain-containing protein [Streptomyces scopuliridis]|uniref:DUF2264 domain-containing protein n=1 Tax=Streptomyces scopuliridis TaxID=452529 RepID=UPI0036B5BE39